MPAMTEHKPAPVTLICGPVCSGKTTLAEAYGRETGAVNLPADDLMLALFGGDAGADHDRFAARARRYLLDLAIKLSKAGTEVTLDWGFWTQAMREEAAAPLREAGIPVRLWRIDLAPETWNRLIEGRNRNVENGSARAYIVDEGLARKCLALYDPPEDGECERIILQKA